MTIRYPINSRWSQLNSSDKFGSIDYSRNINLSKEGYLKLSPRSVNIFDDSANVTNISDQSFNIPVAFGRYDNGEMYIATTEDPFNLTLSATSKTIAEDTEANNPTLSFQSHGVWWQNRFYESTNDSVTYNDGGTWALSAPITSLTTGVRHYLCVFRNRETLVVSNGNVVKQYNTDHSASTHLDAIPSDYEIMGMAYNKNIIGIITRLGDSSEGQNSDAYFFTWDGTTSGATSSHNIGATSAISIAPYKGSFLVTTSAGQLLLWNGGGFQELAHFPFYNGEQGFGDFNNVIGYGDITAVKGDVVYMNIGFSFNGIGKQQEEYQQNNPSGVWCFDPLVGLYPKYSPSNSKAYFHSIDLANINTTTNVFTTSAPIPATGSPVVMPIPRIGGLSSGTIYFVIKLSATTFKLASTKDLADVGTAIDITSADTNNYLYMYDIVDYGISHFSQAGAVGFWGTSNLVYRDIIFGAILLDRVLDNQPTLCTTVPMLENRGHVVLSKIFTNSVTENISNLTIKHAPLDVFDKIIVKIKTKEYLGLPVSSPNTVTADEITWYSSTSGTTSTDLSYAKTAFDDGQELELELTAGIGAGQLLVIADLTESGGVYQVTVEEKVAGYSSGSKSYFIIDAWKICADVDYDTQIEGVFEAPIGDAGKSPQVKIELRGYQTEIQDILLENNVHLPNA